MKKNIRIIHSIPGRVRLNVRGLRGNTPLAHSLETELASHAGIQNVRVNAIAQSVVVHFMPGTLRGADILGLAVSVFPAAAKSVGPKLRASHEPSPACGCKPETCCPPSGCLTSKGKPACKKTRSGCNPVRKGLRRFLAVSAVMGVVFVRQTLLGLTVAQTAMSPLGLIALGLTIPHFKKSAKDLKEGRFTLEMFLGASCVAAVFAGEALTAFEVLWIDSGADLLKAWITERSRRSIAGIIEVSSHHTFILVDGVEVEAEVADLCPGDTVVLHTGEKVCVDGIVTHGEALVDESPISGRPDQVHKQIGDKVMAGTFVKQGVIHVEAEEVGDRTYLARVLQQVEDSLQNRAPIEAVADRLAARLVKIGFLATGATLLLTGSAWRAFTVMLVMACPCATVLSASTAVSAAMNAAASRNILIKGGLHLEQVGKTEIICFDKTGTLTTTEPVLDKIIPVDGVTEQEMLKLAVSAEMHNHHPIAQAIRTAATIRDIEPLPHVECEYHLGMGMRAEIQDKQVLVGNRKLMELHNVRYGSLSSKASALRKRGLTVLYVVHGEDLIGLFGFDNLVRPESEKVIATLREHGAQKIVLITGDEPNTARDLAERMGIDEFHASVMPENKALIVEQLMQEGKQVLMVGDGINDAPALVTADVGIALGAGGSEVAVEAADIALVNDDLEGIVYVHALSQQTMTVVQQNFWLATGSNLAGAALGAAGLLSPIMAGFIHIIHTLGVLANSSRLLAFDPKTMTKREITVYHGDTKNAVQSALGPARTSACCTPCSGSNSD